jgi:predicted enzyme related to lactoylglutathione lyase
MPEVTQHAPGAFCWVELGTTDVASAKKFYASILDWDYQDVPAGPMTYTIVKRRGKDVAGLYELDAEMRKQGVPPHYMSHVATANADESAKKAQELGGTILMAPFDVMDQGRMAVLKDPTGASFAVWQPKQHAGVGLLNEHGALCWNELMTNDVGAARKFYTSLFGWDAQDQDMGPGGMYTMFNSGGRPVGGMMAIAPEMGPVPPNWTVYFDVDNVDARVKTAQGGGAQVLVPPTDIPGIGRFSALIDPQGAAVSLITLAAMPA